MHKSLLVILISLSSVLIYAEVRPECKKNFDVNSDLLSKTMCNCTKDYLDQLRKDNSEYDVTEEMKEVKKYTAQKSLLLDATKLVENFIKKYKEVSEPISDKKYLNKQIANYNSLVNHALLLKSIKTIISKHPQIFNQEGFNLNKYCSNNKNIEADLVFMCEHNTKLMKDRKFYDFTDSFLSYSIDNFVASYRVATDEKSDQAAIDNELGKLLTHAKKAADPDFVIDQYNKLSPGLSSTLSSINNKLEGCLKLKEDSKKTNECREPYLAMNEEDQNKILNELNIVSKSIPTSGITENESTPELKKLSIDSKINEFFIPKIKEAFSKIKETGNHNKIFENYINLSKSIDANQIQTLKKNLTKEFPDESFQFDVPFADFKSKCTTKSSINQILGNALEMEQRVNECNGILDSISNQFKPEKITEIDKKLEDLKNKIKTKLNNPKNRNNQKLQNYVANKWQRGCYSAQPKETPTVISGCLNDPLSPITQFKFGNDIYPILGRITNSSDLKNDFNRNEMKEYLGACDNASSEYDLICKNISKDYEKVKSVKTQDDWAKIHEKAWVVYDDNVEGGYRLVEKKSTGRIIAEASIPAVGNFLPYWMNDYWMRMGITQMEQQAMAQKQWMFDSQAINNYWLSNVYFQNNPFNNGLNGSGNFNFSSINSNNTYNFNLPTTP